MFKKIMQKFTYRYVCVFISMFSIFAYLLIPSVSYAGNPTLAMIYGLPIVHNDPPPICCSNVLFLPGFEASRLYRDERTTTGISEPNTLWEPSANDDVRKLSLNSLGSSTDPTVYTSDILDSVYKPFNLYNIYKSFIAMMNGVVADGTINTWLPFAYDWRMGISDVVSGNTLYSNSTTKNLIQETENLAQNSKTGKVTIIAHSNGGLVAKMLGQELDKKGESNLLDRVVFVDTPQLGTPQGIAGLLHGDSQSILNGFVLSSGVARTFGLNLPGAYGLLPSKEYFNKVVEPVITFAGNMVNSYSLFVDFLTGKIDARTQPKESNLKTPSILSANILDGVQTMHNLLDTWQFPSSIATLFISGWGSPTTKSIDYGNNPKKDVPILRKSWDGDGTVLTDSSEGNSSQTVYFNQGLLKHDTKKDIVHSNIMEASPIRSFLSEIVSTTSPTNSLIDIPLPQYISHQRPNVNGYPWMNSLVVSVHSPVDISVYDNHGGHIGLVPIPGQSNSDIKFIDNTIGGTYEEFAGDKYITLPADAGENYSVQLKGTGTGTFTFEVQKFDSHMNEVASSTYTDLPVTPALLASTTVNTLTISPPLNLDVNGDGKIDVQVLPSATSSPLIHIMALETILPTFYINSAFLKDILEKLEGTKALLKNGRNNWVFLSTKGYSEAFLKNKNIIDLSDDKQKIIKGMFDALTNSLQ